MTGSDDYRGADAADAPEARRVFIPQFPTFMDRSTGERRVVRRELDLRDAQRYGCLTELSGDNAKPWDPAVVEQMDQIVAASSADDWLLAIGNPTMIAIAAAAFASIHGKLNVLQFQSRVQRYEAVEIEFTEEGTLVRKLTAEDEEKK